MNINNVLFYLTECSPFENI